MSYKNGKKLALVCGAGSGLGTEVAKTFATSGYHVVGLNRSTAADPEGDYEVFRVDCSDPSSVQLAIAEIMGAHGAPSVYIHNPAHLVMQPFLDTSVEQFEASWKSMTLSAFVML